MVKSRLTILLCLVAALAYVNNTRETLGLSNKRLCQGQTSFSELPGEYPSPHFSYNSDVDDMPPGNVHCYDYTVRALEDFKKILTFTWFTTERFPVLKGELKDPSNSPLQARWPGEPAPQRVPGRIFFQPSNPAFVQNYAWANSSASGGPAAGQRTSALAQQFPPIEVTASLNFFEQEKAYPLKIRARSSVEGGGSGGYAYTYEVETDSAFPIFMLWTSAASDLWLLNLKEREGNLWSESASYSKPFLASSISRTNPVLIRSSSPPQIVKGMILIYGTDAAKFNAALAIEKVYSVARAGIYVPAYNPSPTIKEFPVTTQ